LHQLVVDTSHVTTSLPAACSVEAIDLPGEPGIVELMRHRSLWREVVCRTSLRGSGRHDFPADREPATHVRLVIYPDGGVARLRALGDPLPPDGLAERGEVDLAALDNGGRVIATSDPQASSPNSMLRPGDARDHRDGWMTRRRREPGNEWAVIRLAARGTVDRIVVDTRPFPGDSPEEISVAAADLPGAAPGELRDAEWTVLLPRTDAEPGARSRFEHLEAPGPISHLRLELHPDGAVGRFRAFGRAEGTEDGGRPDPR
jgi:allantoicase